MKKVFLLFFFSPVLLWSQDGGGEYTLYNNHSCLSKQDRIVIWNEIKQNLKSLRDQNITAEKKQSVSFIWPLKKDSALMFNNYFGISNFVDQDTTAGLILDYNCLGRSYDGHKGTDIFTWPFPWYLYDNDYIDVIAAEDGVIINKHDGHDDDHCPSTMGGNWNAVYIEHNDGSIVWYGHLKTNSLTSKSIGQTVTKGEYLGKVASSGYSSGPHLHLEIHDNNWNLIDPFQGPCNGFNSNSWWTNQRDYREPMLNALLTHHGKPIHGCPGVNEEPKLSNYFNIGDSIYFASYFSDREDGDPAEYRIIDPNGNIWDSWNHTASTTFNASWYYWKRLLPVDGPFGTWMYEVDFKGNSYTHYFDYHTVNFIDQINNPRKLDHVTDVLGRKSKSTSNTILLFIYNDGTVEKKIIIP